MVNDLAPVLIIFGGVMLGCCAAGVLIIIRRR